MKDILEELTTKELKKEYNNLLQRHMKAAVYMDDEKVPIQDREKWMPEFQKIGYHLNRMLNMFDIRGIEVSVKEVLGGFVVEDIDEKKAS